jgi:hypothetical protein
MLENGLSKQRQSQLGTHQTLQNFSGGFTMG